MLAMGIRQRADPLTQAVRAHYRQWLILGLVMSILPGVDMAAHIGGLAGGFLVGLIAGLPGLPNSPREILWKVLAGFAIAVTVYAFFQDYLCLSRARETNEQYLTSSVVERCGQLRYYLHISPCFAGPSNC